MRNFEYARDAKALTENIELQAFPDAQIPEYQTTAAAGADFFAAEDVTIPSIWSNLWEILRDQNLQPYDWNLDTNVEYEVKENARISKLFSPTLVHTGIKACMEPDEVLYLYNRSSNPKKLGLILANSVGVIDADYYNNADNDGEIMFAFINIKPWPTKIKKGDRIGQGVFQKFLRPTGDGLRIKDKVRSGGFGSTNG